jgi:hypothetical protein
MGRVISLRPGSRRPWPPGEIRVGIDFDRWCVAYYRAGKLFGRTSFDSETEARDEAGRLIASGLYTLGPDDPPGITYHAWVQDDGGDYA